MFLVRVINNLLFVLAAKIKFNCTVISNVAISRCNEGESSSHLKSCIRVDGLNLVPGYFSLYGVERELISVSSNVFALVAEDRNRRYMIYS